MKKNNTAYFLIFMLLCVLPFAAFLFGVGKNNTAEQEQRKLAEKPVLSFSALAEFPQQYEAYFNDHLPGRHTLISWNNRLNYFLQSGSSNGSVIQGRDGWLFYNAAGTDGDPVGDYYCTVPVKEAVLQAAADQLSDAAAQLQEKNIRLYVFVAPNKECMYGADYFPAYYPEQHGKTRGDMYVEYLKAHTDLPIIYAKDALRKAMEAYPQYLFYYKQDTHWNGLGAYVGSRELLMQMGTDLPELSEIEIRETQKKTKSDLVGMMALKSGAPETEYLLNYAGRTDIIRKSDGILLRTSGGKDSRKVLIVRDSYGEAMIDILGSVFSECVFVQRGDYTRALLEQEQPDAVVYETVERYVNFVKYFHAE